MDSNSLIRLLLFAIMLLLGNNLYREHLFAKERQNLYDRIMARDLTEVRHKAEPGSLTPANALKKAFNDRENKRSLS